MIATGKIDRCLMPMTDVNVNSLDTVLDRMRMVIGLRGVFHSSTAAFQSVESSRCTHFAV